MRCVVYNQFGAPGEVLGVAEVPMPEPRRGEVRVKMRLAPIHNHDLWTIDGTYGQLPALPARCGTEAMGTVDAIGEGVTALKVGQRVAGGAGATWADFYTAHAGSLVPLPDSVGDDVACQMVLMPLSARLLLEIMGVKPGDWIVQNAANGAVGKMVAVFAADMGVNVVGLVRRNAAVDELSALGISNVVSTDEPDWRERVKAVTGGKPIIRGVESVGGDGARMVLEVMGDGSTLYSFGDLTSTPMRIPAGKVIFNNIKIEGFWLARLWPKTPPEMIGRLIGEIVGKAAAGKLGLSVEQRFDLADARLASVAARTMGRTGKIVLTGAA